MEAQSQPVKKILEPSVIHDAVPEVKKSEHLRKNIPEPDRELPENPERNYHHEEFITVNGSHDEVKHADDDEWNGEDA